MAKSQHDFEQARKEREGERGEKAGGQLLLNDSLAETPGSYIPTQVLLGEKIYSLPSTNYIMVPDVLSLHLFQFENSLGKLQVVTVKAPRQIIDVGVVNSLSSATLKLTCASF